MTYLSQVQNYVSVVIILCFLLMLPAIFDVLSRYYENLKLESEIQNTIMTRYFYYQLVNIYVTIGYGRVELTNQLLTSRTISTLLGYTIPTLSLYFTDLVIVKIFTAVPLEMCRPFQLFSIYLVGTILNKKSVTRRELRTGAFYAWPMLYGWVYPQILLVMLIMITYSFISPLLMPFGIVFFIISYHMYKYQLLYVYVNTEQSLGFMWYAVFNRSLICLLFMSITLCGIVNYWIQGNQFVTYLLPSSGSDSSVQLEGGGLENGYVMLWFCIPLPISIMYFWHYCHSMFRTTSLVSQ